MIVNQSHPYTRTTERSRQKVNQNADKMYWVPCCSLWIWMMLSKNINRRKIKHKKFYFTRLIIRYCLFSFCRSFRVMLWFIWFISVLCCLIYFNLYLFFITSLFHCPFQTSILLLLVYLQFSRLLKLLAYCETHPFYSPICFV